MKLGRDELAGGMMMVKMFCGGVGWGAVVVVLMRRKQSEGEGNEVRSVSRFYGSKHLPGSKAVLSRETANGGRSKEERRRGEGIHVEGQGQEPQTL